MLFNSVTFIACFALALAAWEYGWRAYGAVPGIVNSDGLWAMQRRRLAAGQGDATVLIGSSRTLSNVQLPVWERLAGRRPIPDAGLPAAATARPPARA